jgi:hypothetical protein
VSKRRAQQDAAHEALRAWARQWARADAALTIIRRQELARHAADDYAAARAALNDLYQTLDLSALPARMTGMVAMQATFMRMAHRHE